MKCPSCNSILGIGATKCYDCKWEEKKPEEKKPNHQCEFKCDEGRCPLPASMSHGTRGEGPWYCRLHFSNPGAVGREIVNRMMNDGMLAVKYKADRRPVQATKKQKTKQEKKDSVIRAVDKLLGKMLVR